jgi:hypothetical protein
MYLFGLEVQQDTTTYRVTGIVIAGTTRDWNLFSLLDFFFLLIFIFRSQRY